MKPSLKIPRLVIYIVFLLIIAAVAYIWGSGLMDSLYSYRSPLHNAPPQPGNPVGKPLTRRVILVLIDALRVDTAGDSSIMPFLNELRKHSATATMHSRPPSYSAPGYSIIFTGAWPDISDGPALNTDDEDMQRWTQDNLFSAAHRSGLKTAISAYNFFEKLVPQEDVNNAFYTAGEDANADREVLEAALPWLKSGDDELVLIHIDQVDYAGHHEGGPIDPRWKEAATRADNMLKEIASEVDLAQDTLIAFSDHGQIDAGGHGGDEPIVLMEPFVITGKGIRPGDYGDIEMIDLAPTVAVLLGTNIPATSQGKVLFELLDIPNGEEQTILEAQAGQQALLYKSYTEAIGRPGDPSTMESLEPDVVQHAMEEARQSRLRSERIPRFILAGLIFGFLVYVLYRNWNPRYPWMAGAALLYILLFHIRYSVMGGWMYSLSSVSSAEDLINFTGTTAIISLAIPWWIIFTYLGIFKTDPKRAAETTYQLVIAVILPLTLPVSWHYAWNGAIASWTLPDMPSMFLGFICLLQILVIAILGILLSGVSAAVTWFQKWLLPIPAQDRKI
jgi:hypothetical protein